MHDIIHLWLPLPGTKLGQDIGDDYGRFGQAPSALSQKSRHVMRWRDERVCQLQAHALLSVDAQACDIQRALYRALRAPEMPAMCFHNHSQPCAQMTLRQSLFRQMKLPPCHVSVRSGQRPAAGPCTPQHSCAGFRCPAVAVLTSACSRCASTILRTPAQLAGEFCRALRLVMLPF